MDDDLILMHGFQSTLPAWGGTAKTHKIISAFLTKPTSFPSVFFIIQCFHSYVETNSDLFGLFFRANLPGKPCLLPVRTCQIIRVPSGS